MLIGWWIWVRFFFFARDFYTWSCILIFVSIKWVLKKGSGRESVQMLSKCTIDKKKQKTNAKEYADFLKIGNKGLEQRINRVMKYIYIYVLLLPSSGGFPLITSNTLKKRNRNKWRSKLCFFVSTSSKIIFLQAGC